MKAKFLAASVFSVFAASAGALAQAASYYTTDADAVIPRSSNAITPADQARDARAAGPVITGQGLVTQLPGQSGPGAVDRTHPGRDAPTRLSPYDTGTSSAGSP